LKYDPLKHHRRSVRLAGYDYAARGAYFVTIVAWRREKFFADPAVRRLAEACWRDIPAHTANVTLDAWVVMPNHVHGIIVIGEADGNHGNIDGRRGVQLNAPTTNEYASNANDINVRGRNVNDVFSMMSPGRNTLAVIMRTYKAAVTTACREAQLGFGWQRGYYEHVVRGDADLARIRSYIETNPARWMADPLNSVNHE
jgi:putative transposase